MLVGGREGVNDRRAPDQNGTSEAACGACLEWGCFVLVLTAAGHAFVDAIAAGGLGVWVSRILATRKMRCRVCCATAWLGNL
eukprot:3941747-Rhodomonas_salina.7